MPKLTDGFIENVNQLSLKQLQSAVLTYAKKNDDFCNFIILNYFNDTEHLTQIFNETEEQVIHALNSGSRGNIYQQLAASIDKSIKHINHYRDLTKDKIGEARLLHFVLDYFFKHYSQFLGTCFTVFDSKLSRTVSRFIGLVNNKLHSDYKIEFEDDINNYLIILHQKSNHLDFVYLLPHKI